MTSHEADTARTVTRRGALATLGAGSVAALAGCLDAIGLGSGSDGGTINASGSNTVRPLTEAVGEAYEQENEDAVVEVRGPGTGAGFEEFTQGDTDIQNASRDISDDELNRADDNGIEFTRFTVGQDALTVYIHPANDWVDYISVEELNMIYDFESEVDTWSDVRSEWPDEPIDVWSRDTDSGTFDYFTEAINGEAARVRQDDIAMRQETIAIVDGVSQNQYAIGFGGWSYWQENQDQVDAVPVQDRGESEAFEPSAANIESGDYTPLTRPLFTFYNNEALQDRELLQDFARFYFDNVQGVARDVGFFGAADDTLAANHDELDDLLS